MKKTLIPALLVLTTNFAFSEPSRDPISVFGLMCNESVASVANRVKLNELPKETMDAKKLIMHPDFWNIGTFSDDSFNRYAANLPEELSYLNFVSLKFSRGALVDVHLQFKSEADDREHLKGNAKALKLAKELSSKYTAPLKWEFKSEGMYSLSQYKDYTIDMGRANILIGSRPGASVSEMTSVLLVRVRFSPDCGVGARNKSL